jgi:hypothetical protein
MLSSSCVSQPLIFSVPHAFSVPPDTRHRKRKKHKNSASQHASTTGDADQSGRAATTRKSESRRFSPSLFLKTAGTGTGCANHPDLAELTTPVKFFLFGGGR